MENLLRLATSIAEQAHAGQVDKAGAPYINHPKAVAALVDTELEKIAALLHDVVEDTSLTFADLSALGIPQEAVTALECLTHREGETYAAYICRIQDSPLAVRVKVADLTHNADLSRLPQITAADRERQAKYLHFLEVLKTQY